MFTLSGNPDIMTSIPITSGEMNRSPRFAASLGTAGKNNLFVTFPEGNKIMLKCSIKGGNSMSVPIKIMDLKGNLKLFKIAANGDIAVTVAVEENGPDLVVRGATGTISPAGSTAKFTHQACPERAIKNAKFSDVLDLAIRINDDGTSDDYVFTKATNSANVSHVGHHPHAPS